MNAHETMVINAYRELFSRLSAICLDKHLNNHQVAMRIAHELDHFKEPARTDGMDSPRKKTVPKTLADLPKRPFWRKLGQDIRDKAAGTITNNFNSHYLPSYIARGDTYSESLDGPWLPFTKELECE